MLMPVDYAQISSTEDQRPTTTAPTQVTLNQNDSISGIEHSAEQPGTIRIVDSGIYVLIAAPQVGRQSGTQDRFVDFWIRKNGTDIANSNVRAVISGKDSKDVIINQCNLCWCGCGGSLVFCARYLSIINWH